MAIKLHNANILEQTSDALILPIDGIGPGHEGALARKFAQQFPDEWGRITSRINYPLPLGQVLTIPTESNSCFEYVIPASLLNHINEIPEMVMQNTVKEVVKHTLRKAFDINISTLSSVLLKGGWRLNTDLALMAMLEGYETMLPASKKITFEIYETNTKKYQRMKNLCDSFGWDV